MATRTEPMEACSLPVRWTVQVGACGLGEALRLVGGRPRRGCLAALGLDELGEPPQLALDGLERVRRRLLGVAVDPGAGALQRAAHALPPLLQPRPAALEDAHAHLGVGLAEEGEADPERLVVPGRRSGLGEQLL